VPVGQGLSESSCPWKRWRGVTAVASGRAWCSRAHNGQQGVGAHERAVLCARTSIGEDSQWVSVGGAEGGGDAGFPAVMPTAREARAGVWGIGEGTQPEC
jgi:hypothetical protein